MDPKAPEMLHFSGHRSFRIHPRKNETTSSSSPSHALKSPELSPEHDVATVPIARRRCRSRAHHRSPELRWWASSTTDPTTMPPPLPNPRSPEEEAAPLVSQIRVVGCRPRNEGGDAAVLIAG
jgi:hypothetical protein